MVKHNISSNPSLFFFFSNQCFDSNIFATHFIHCFISLPPFASIYLNRVLFSLRVLKHLMILNSFPVFLNKSPLCIMNVSQFTNTSKSRAFNVHIKRSYFIGVMLSKPNIDFQILKTNSICQRILYILT